jgi:hypothetical protein
MQNDVGAIAYATASYLQTLVGERPVSDGPALKAPGLVGCSKVWTDRESFADTFALENEVVYHGVDESGRRVDEPQLVSRLVGTSLPHFTVGTSNR